MVYHWAEIPLPFFKQYFGGGANGMRGWCTWNRDVDRSHWPLMPPTALTTAPGYTVQKQTLNTVTISHDHSQYHAAQRALLFIDAGNVWNMRKLKVAVPTVHNSSSETCGGTWASMPYRPTRLQLFCNQAWSRLFRFKRRNGLWKRRLENSCLSFNDVFRKIFARGWWRNLPQNGVTKILISPLGLIILLRLNAEH